MGFLNKLSNLFSVNTNEGKPQCDRGEAAATPRTTRPVPAPVESASRLADPHCPYCGYEFNPPPKAKKKCPACGNFVRVRWRTDGLRHLIREDQLAEVEAELLAEDEDEDPDAAYTIHTKVVGVSYDNDDGGNRQKLLADCRVGEQLKLKHKPVPQDKNAVAVYRHNGKQIGWLSRGVADQIVDDLHEKDLTVLCEITQLTGGTPDKPARGCNIRITMK